MKKLTLLLAILVTFSAKAQLTNGGSALNKGSLLTVVDSLAQVTAPIPMWAAVICRCDSAIHYWTGTQWMTVMFATPKTDTIVTRSFNTGFQVSTTKDGMVFYSVKIDAGLSLTGGTVGSIILEKSPDNSTWTTIPSVGNGSTGTLTIGLNTTNSQTAVLSGFVPRGFYVRLRTSTTTGTPTYTFVNGQELRFLTLKNTIMATTNSNFGSLNIMDLLKGGLLALLTSLGTGLDVFIESGTLPSTSADWRKIAIGGVVGFLAYLSKNFITNSSGQIAKKETTTVNNN